MESEGVRGSLDHCVKCTICETFCPVAAVTPLFPGPKYAGPQSERFRGVADSVDHSLDYCSSCGVCTQVCPQGVKIAEINSRARAELKKRDGIPLRDQLLARPAMLGKLGVPFSPFANASLALRPTRIVGERLLGIDRDAPLPRFARRTFQSWARRHPKPDADRSVVYFHGCATNYNEPRVGRLVVDILEHNGFRVLIPPQGCCGLPLQSNGNFDAARPMNRALVARLAPYARLGYDVVGNSTSCTLMLKREAHEILGIDDEELQVLSPRVFDICEFLLGLHDRGELRTDFRALPLRVPYHAPCQQRGHGIGKPALDLMRLIPELDVIELDRDCCGVAGTYGYKKEKHAIAMAVGKPLFDDVRGAQGDVCACDSETCRWQITAATGVESVHPIELLHRAYGLAGT
jgi:glycerol-3-phosphate dehydrogenase subunit C